MLGLSNRVRKSAILQEAVSTITSLKRERDELRRDRDRLQQEVSKLATFLQYSQLGTVAAAMAQQSNQQLSHMTPSVEQLDPQQQRAVAASSGVQAAHTHRPNVSCYPVCTYITVALVLLYLASYLCYPVFCSCRAQIASLSARRSRISYRSWDHVHPQRYQCPVKLLSLRSILSRHPPFQHIPQSPPT